MRRALPLVLVAAPLSLTAGALAGGTLVGDLKDAHTTADVFTDPPPYDPTHPYAWVYFAGQWVDGARADSFEQGAGPKTVNGSIGYHNHGLSAEGSYNWNHGYDTGSPGKGGSFSQAMFDGDVSMNSSWDQSDRAAGADTSTYSQVLFTVDEDTPWSWAAHVLGASSGDGLADYSFSLQQSDPDHWDGLAHWIDIVGEDYFSVSDSRSGNFDEDIYLDGVLPAGTYMLTISMRASMGGNGFLYNPWSEGSATAAMSGGVFYLGGPVPAPAAATVLGLGALVTRRRR